MASNEKPNNSHNVDDTNDYNVNDDEDDGVDVEDTIAEDELHETEEDNDLVALREEAEIDIEELRRRYYSAPNNDNELAEDSEEDVTNDGEQVEDGDNEINPNTCLLEFMNTENGEVEGYNSDDDGDFIYQMYKPPRIGPEYQEMNIPQIIPGYKSTHSADLLWKPTDKITNEQINDYQASVIDFSQDMVCNKIPSAPGVEHTVRPEKYYTNWDSEEALYLLMTNNYDFEKAKKEYAEGPPDVNLPRTTHFGIYLPWEEEDVKRFERGMHNVGKKFWKIRSDYMPGRSIGEIIHFYYRFKKSERWDMFIREHIEKYGGIRTPDHTDPMEEMINTIARSEVIGEQANVIIAESERYTIDEKSQPK